MNYQDVTPDYLIYSATTGAADFALANGFVTARVNGAGVSVKIPYKGIESTNGGIVSSVAATAAQWTIDTGAPVANTTYAFSIGQTINGVEVQRRVSYTTPAAPVANDAAIGLDKIVDKLIQVGVFQLASSSQALNVITITSAAANPFFELAGGVNVTLTNTVPGVAPIGQGSDLLSIVDLNGASPIAGATYDVLKLDYQVDRIGLEGASREQRKSLIVLFRDSIVNLTALQTQVNTVLAATLDTSGASANIEQIALQ